MIEERRLQVLKALRDFLDRVGEPWWAEWVQIAIEDGRFPEAGPASPPFTLDEVVLGLDRTDRVPPHLLPWANAVLDCLRCLLHAPETCRGCPRDEVHEGAYRAIERARQEGRLDPVLMLRRREPDGPGGGMAVAWMDD